MIRARAVVWQSQRQLIIRRITPGVKSICVIKTKVLLGCGIITIKTASTATNLVGHKKLWLVRVCCVVFSDLFLFRCGCLLLMQNVSALLVPFHFSHPFFFSVQVCQCQAICYLCSSWNRDLRYSKTERKIYTHIIWIARLRLERKKYTKKTSAILFKNIQFHVIKGLSQKLWEKNRVDYHRKFQFGSTSVCSRAKTG